ncbi:hypothetical protein M378DRAFT_16848 [Amanita muscaria Koide BX008]|uniref:Uncharacterized protein n=1 Tax=Amanita muscaria (strain Koide BX008) TaxID=946122 RepID=A0A0C2WJ71_AMAMK|nr:hypothetical protein M378DRAFT_16848 [Amanita muscaria Koide BX008]
MSSQVPRSATSLDGAVFDDKHDPDLSIPSQASTSLRPRLINHLGIAVPSKAPSTTSVSFGLATINHSNREARNEDNHGNPIQTEIPLVTPRHPSIDRGYGTVQRREAGGGVDPDFSSPKGAPSITTELTVDRVVQRGEANSPCSHIIISPSNCYNPA